MIEVGGINYYQRADGSLVPEHMIKDEDKLKDSLVCDLASKILDLRSQMDVLKKSVMDDMDSYISVMAEKYGAKIEWYIATR